MKLAKFMALMLATGSALCVSSCGDDDDDDDNNSSKTVDVAEAVTGSYVQDLVYSMAYGGDTLTNDTLTITKVSDNLVNLHFSQYVGMGSGTSQLNVYNVAVSKAADGTYALGVSTDTTAATKAQMTSSKYDVAALSGTVDTETASINFDFLIAAMNATFSNEFENAKKIAE